MTDEDIKRTDDIVKSIIELSCEALELIDGKKREYEDCLPKLSWLPKSLYDKYKRIQLNNERLANCVPSNIEKYPFKSLVDGYWKFCDERGIPKKSLHRYVVEKNIGRKLSISEIVHHIDEIKVNNDIDNLVIVTKKEHAQIHHGKKE